MVEEYDLDKNGKLDEEERAIYLALMESIKIADGQDEKKSPDAIPSILSDALSVGFDQHVGHDYINDSKDRFEYYHKVCRAIQGAVLFGQIKSPACAGIKVNLTQVGGWVNIYNISIDWISTFLCSFI